MIRAIPWKPHVAPWMALLGACRVHGNVEMGERVAKENWSLKMLLVMCCYQTSMLLLETAISEC